MPANGASSGADNSRLRTGHQYRIKPYQRESNNANRLWLPLFTYLLIAAASVMVSRCGM